MSGDNGSGAGKRGQLGKNRIMQICYGNICSGMLENTLAFAWLKGKDVNNYAMSSPNISSNQKNKRPGVGIKKMQKLLKPWRLVSQSYRGILPVVFIIDIIMLLRPK